MSEYAAAGKEIEVPEQLCPDCERALGGWSGYRRPVRAGRDYRIWIRRGRCKPCDRTHALLPDFVHERRYDVVEVIGAGLELGIGWPRYAEGCSGDRCAVLDGARLAAPAPGSGAGAGATLRRARVPPWVVWKKARELLAAVGGLWRFWNAICGGKALGTNTKPPLLATEGSASMRR